MPSLPMQTQANTSRPEKNWYILTNASRKAIRTSAKLPAQGLNVQCHLRLAACNSGSYQRDSCQEARNKKHRVRSWLFSMLRSNAVHRLHRHDPTSPV